MAAVDKSIEPMRYISANKLCLQVFGQWFTDDPIASFRYWFKFLYQQIVLFVAFTLPISGEIIFLANNADDVGKLAEGLYLLLSEFFTPVKVFFFLGHKMYIKQLIEDLKSEKFKPKEPEHREIIAKAIKKGRFICITYATMCLISVLVALIIPMGEKVRTLPTSVQYPYVQDVLDTPYYQILYLLQIIYKPTGVMIYGAVETLPPAFMASAIAQFDVLIFNLENLDKIVRRRISMGLLSEKNAFETFLGECVQHHKDILKFVKLIERAYSLQLFVQFLLSGLVICLVGVQVLSIQNPMHHFVQMMWVSVYFVCMCLEVYLVCYFGNELIWRSKYLTTAAYNSQWINLSPSMKRSFLIFIERCNRPVIIRAGRIFDVSMDTYTNLLNWSYKAFAVMNRMKS